MKTICLAIAVTSALSLLSWLTAWLADRADRRAIRLHGEYSRPVRYVKGY